MSLFLRLGLWTVLCCVVGAGPAAAAWHQASSRHFVIYSDEKPERLRAYAEKLERFDKAVRLLRNAQDPQVGDGNRLTIFVVSDDAAVRKIAGAKGSFLYGFYLGRYSGSIAFTPRRADTDRWGLQADSVFFHEYAHHLMFQEFDLPYPNWYVEGFAELIGSPRFEKDGSVTLGVAPKHRAYGLYSGIGLSTREILASQPEKMTSDERESIYGRGWLLTHFLAFEPSRKGQFSRYMRNLAKGMSMESAAADAFGDLKTFDRDAQRYLSRPKLLAYTVSGALLAPGPIEVAALSPGAAEALPWRMISKRGVDAATAKTVVEKVRAVAARYPADPLVLRTLAEAEFDAGEHRAALTAAEAASRADRQSVEALVYQGRSLVALADKKDPAGSIEKARRVYLAANKIDTEDPEPLYLYYRSFIDAGEAPTPNALAALHYASVLAPQDEGLRLTSAFAFLNERKLPEAKMELLPIAYDPHGGKGAASARKAIERIEAKDATGALAALTDEKSTGAAP